MLERFGLVSVEGCKFSQCPLDLPQSYHRQVRTIFSLNLLLDKQCDPGSDQLYNQVGGTKETATQRLSTRCGQFFLPNKSVLTLCSPVGPS